LTSIINPRDFPEVSFEPITKKYWKTLDTVLSFDLDIGPIANPNGLSLDYSSISQATSEQIMTLAKVKQIEEWLESNLNKGQYKHKTTNGSWKLKRRLRRARCGTLMAHRTMSDYACKSLPKFVVYLKAEDFDPEILKVNDLPLTKIQTVINEFHNQQLENSAVDSVDLRKTLYWGKYNFKILIHRIWSSSTPNTYSDILDNKLMTELYEFDPEARYFASRFYMTLDPADIDQLAMLKLSYPEVIKHITQVELVDQ
jgi:hypothetical protein